VRQYIGRASLKLGFRYPRIRDCSVWKRRMLTLLKHIIILLDHIEHANEGALTRVCLALMDRVRRGSEDNRFPFLRLTFHSNARLHSGHSSYWVPGTNY
jgi:hypothetical protein